MIQCWLGAGVCVAVRDAGMIVAVLTARDIRQESCRDRAWLHWGAVGGLGSGEEEAQSCEAVWQRNEPGARVTVFPVLEAIS